MSAVLGSCSKIITSCGSFPCLAGGSPPTVSLISTGTWTTNTNSTDVTFPCVSGRAYFIFMHYCRTDSTSIANPSQILSLGGAAPDVYGSTGYNPGVNTGTNRDQVGWAWCGATSTGNMTVRYRLQGAVETMGASNQSRYMIFEIQGINMTSINSVSPAGLGAVAIEPRTSGTSILETLPAFSNPNNIALATLNSRYANNFTPGASFTIGTEYDDGTVTRTWQYGTPNDNTVDATYSNTPTDFTVTMISLELKV